MEKLAEDSVAPDIEKGAALFEKGDWEHALQAFLAIKTENPDHILEISYYTGLCYAKLKSFTEAQPYLEKYIHDAKNSMRVYQCRMTLAYVYVMMKKAKMAEYELTMLVNNGFESAQLYATMAYAAWSQESYTSAIEWYEKALGVDSNNLTALNGLGFILVDIGKDVKRGLRFCKRAVDKNPDNPVYLDSLGWAYYKDGRLPEAKKYLQKARDRDPGNVYIQEHLRTVERAAGKS